MKKVTKAQVKAAVKKKGEWVGTVCASKLSPKSVMAFPDVRFVLTSTGEVVRDFRDGRFTFDDYVNNFQYYNCNAECGQSIAFYEEE